MSNPRRTGTSTSQQVPRGLVWQRTIDVNLKDDPWTPIVLTLDGGGIRGLSSLFMLRRVLERAKLLLDENLHDNPIHRALSDVDNSSTTHGPPQPQANSSSRQATVEGPSSSLVGINELPLPCYFFDYIIGTSTGGLIAVMLGRLRMSIDDCIMEYWKFGNFIFRPRRYISLYSGLKVEEAVKKVAMKHCKCHTICHTEKHLLRQHDYAEEGDPRHSVVNYLNKTCKTALVSQRRGKDDETYLWRSYTHHARFESNGNELNPGSMATNRTEIWEACRATSAAPFYFSKPTVDGYKHMDGGVGDNNPSDIAWNEVRYMSDRNDPEQGQVAMLISLGTGAPKGETRFGGVFNFNLLPWMRRQMTDTQKAHLKTQAAAEASGSAYFRFDVPAQDGKDSSPGLSSIKLSECKKNAIVPWWRRLNKKRKPTNLNGSSINQADTSMNRADESAGNETNEPTANQANETQNAPSVTMPNVSSRPEWYMRLQDTATEKKGGGYKPHKYLYSTFEILFDRTEEYCINGLYDPRQSQDLTMETAINRCAYLLVEYARDRERADLTKWRRFISHPHYRHPLHQDS